MKLHTILFLLLLAANSVSAQGNFMLLVNGDSVYLDLNNPTQYVTKKGEKLNIELTQPAVLTYSDDMVSFNHSKQFSVSNTVIEQGIEQCMIINSTGNGFMLQKYSTINPSMLVPLMVNELTKESVSYGYKKEERDVKLKLVSGQEIKGTEAKLTYKGETEIYTVYAWGGKDEGVLVVTMLLSEDYWDDDLPFIDLFLKTLRIH
ncbi:MAG: hypothetical protein H6603_03990 [Flavobacteriales bacterium]|nr:hypothetical protein [Flavobacteriales bacterium]